MELLAAAAIRCGASADVAARILEAVSTEEGIRILEEAGLVDPAMKDVCERVQFYLDRRGAGKIRIEVMIYSMDHGLLAQSKGAGEMLEQLLDEGDKT